MSFADALQLVTYCEESWSGLTQLHDESMKEMVLGEFRAILGIKAIPHSISIHRCPRSMPQYDVDHLSRVDTIDVKLKQHPNLFLTGNAYRGIGIPDCIHQGEITAERIISRVLSSSTIVEITS